MTFREKLKKEHPERVNDAWYIGGCNGCPHQYGYEEGTHCSRNYSNCRECWDREIPEPVVITNADYIQSMSVKELGDWLCDIIDNCDDCYFRNECNKGHTGTTEWLKQVYAKRRAEQ